MNPPLLDTLDRTIGDRRHLAAVSLSVRPVDFASCEVAFTEELRVQIQPEIKEAVENGVHSSYLQGKRSFDNSSLFLNIKHPNTKAKVSIKNSPTKREKKKYLNSGRQSALAETESYLLFFFYPHSFSFIHSIISMNASRNN